MVTKSKEMCVFLKKYLGESVFSTLDDENKKYVLENMETKH